MQKLLSFKKIRSNSVGITKGLSKDELCLQPSAEVSPPLWHLAHTTWFFEKFILEKFVPNHKRFNDQFHLFFNSYYKSVGNHWKQSERGSIEFNKEKILKYRNFIDECILNLIDSKPQREITDLIIAGLHHEEQHQELLHMDIKSIKKAQGLQLIDISQNKDKWFEISEGLYPIGTSSESFTYDNEGPQHKSYLYSCKLSTQLVTNAEYKEFIKSGGYENPLLWLSKGWNWIEENKINSPLYWSEELKDESPVSHISYYEADAYANFKELRLPTEYEHEVFDKAFPTQKQRWAWTSSQYSAYPHFKKFSGDLSEYNAKFMCNQFVLRGGCLYTPENHWRTTYRNFFEPEQRWMFSGIRLAMDVRK